MALFTHLFVVFGNDDGQARTPPMGWRNWNQFQGDITQALIERQMVAMAERSREVVGLPGTRSLIDIGYSRAGLDDAWQACGSGVTNSKVGSFHSAAGIPLWNRTYC